MKPSKLMCLKMVHSNTKKAKSRVRQSQVCYLHTTHSSVLRPNTSFFFFSDVLGDALTYHANHLFSTKDVDNDKSSISCAVTRTGPWWYNGCQHSNLNGAYNKGSGKANEGITWHQFKGSSYSLKRAEMKMRPLIAQLANE